MVDLIKLVLIISVLVNAAYKSNGISGVMDLFKNFLVFAWGMLGMLNIVSININSNSIITEFFGGYITYL
jgi:hypothetical protein